MYAALRDCQTTLQLDPSQMKAHFRLAKCLFELLFTEEACKCLAEFKLKFPDESHSRACKALDMDIQSASEVVEVLQQQQQNSSGGTADGMSGIYLRNKCFVVFIISQ